jgi:hypothetical protein
VLAHPVWQIILGFYLIALFVVINVLNVMWFTGILKHVHRNLQGDRGSQPRNSE